MSRVIDRAQQQALMLTGLLIQRHQARPRPQGNGICGECGDPIPDARRQAAPGAERCLECQVRQEKRAAIHAGSPR
ncbi:TraR/DksA C4-type zinc finger protein [Aeromonas diversa]|uniref:TraR/DksA C4-type zinc finger protein n=1 Tax=Aeromonas diversa TaxID=502790 RepID=UPI0034634207